MLISQYKIPRFITIQTYKEYHVMKQKKKKKEQEQIAQQYHDQIVFDLKRAFLQFITLIAINQGSKYAYEIKSDILRYTQGGFDVDKNNLYKKLRTLEKDNILESRPGPSERGAQRKYYDVTPLGKELLSSTCDFLFPLMKALRDNIAKK